MGYFIHFLPHRIELKAERVVINMPIAGKVAMMVCLIFLVIQTKSAGIQPFIYFQFYFFNEQSGYPSSDPRLSRLSNRPPVYILS